MKSSIGSPSKKDIRRFQMMNEAGCIACIQIGIQEQPGDIHHLLYAGKRVSHQHTVCLCEYHHRGLPLNGLTDKEAYDMLGPSLAKSKKEFHERFGDDETLLWFQNEILERIKGSYV